MEEEGKRREELLNLFDVDYNQHSLEFRLYLGANFQFMDLLPGYIAGIWKSVIQRVTVVKFRVNSGNGNAIGCFEIKIRTEFMLRS